MKLAIIFGLRHQRYDGEHAAEALDCWDEYSLDENPDGFDEALNKHLANVGPGKDFAIVRRIDIRFNDQKVYDLLSLDAPVIGGEVSQ